MDKYSVEGKGKPTFNLLVNQTFIMNTFTLLISNGGNYSRKAWKKTRVIKKAPVEAGAFYRNILIFT